MFVKLVEIIIYKLHKVNMKQDFIMILRLVGECYEQDNSSFRYELLYASVEMLHHPELAGKPMAVGGDPEARHGIVLTANYIAKRAGVKTGMALWQARQVCPEIIFVPPRMDLYLRFSRMAQEIYSEYTDQREPFGIDESWLDVTASTSIKGDGMKIAKEISSRIKYELGLP